LTMDVLDKVIQITAYILVLLYEHIFLSIIVISILFFTVQLIISYRGEIKKIFKLEKKESHIGLKTITNNKTAGQNVKATNGENMSDLWSNDSLRGMYWQTMQNSTDRRDVGFFKKMALKSDGRYAAIVEHDKKMQSFINILKAPICPHCLKTIIMSEISFTCPFCDAEHFEKGTTVKAEGGGLFDMLAASIGTTWVQGMLMATIFGGCMKCKSKIQYLACPYCQQGVDLFAPYKYEELERKRYGR